MPSTTVRMLWIIWNAATMMLLIMGTINITNYESTKQSAEQLLNILTDNEGVFPQPEKPADNHPLAATPPSTDNPPLSADVPPHKEDTFSSEAPFNTRYFTVTLDTSGTTDTIADTLQKCGRIARLTFANSVVEIKPGRRNELFERFDRPDTSRNTQTGGFGIGLATVKAIVEAHKGKVSARAADAHSIQFVLILPL